MLPTSMGCSTPLLMVVIYIGSVKNNKINNKFYLLATVNLAPA